MDCIGYQLLEKTRACTRARVDGRHFSSVHSTELSPAPARPGTGIDAAMDLARIDEHGHRLATSTTHPEHGPPAGHRLGTDRHPEHGHRRHSRNGGFPLL